MILGIDDTKDNSKFLEGEENESQKGQLCFSDFQVVSPGPPRLCFPPNPSHGKWYSLCHVFLWYQATVICSVILRGDLECQWINFSQGLLKGTLYANREGHGYYSKDPSHPQHSLLYPVYLSFNP